MTEPTTPQSLDGLFRPRSVAIVGATSKAGKPGHSLLRALIEARLSRPASTRSRRRSAEVDGLKAYKSVRDLPETPDVALIITPAATVPGMIDECGAKGIRHAIVFSAGFEETSEGKELARQLADAARRHGITVIGPNCQGVWSVRPRHS